MLITLAKFDQLKSTTVPGMVLKIGKLLDLDVAKDQALLTEVVDNMDQMVFEDYIKRRSLALVQVIQDGVLNGGIDWLNSPKPTGRSRQAEQIALSPLRGPALHAQSDSSLGRSTCSCR